MRKPSPALLVAVVSLVFASTGISVAAIRSGGDQPSAHGATSPNGSAAKAKRGPRGPRGPRGYTGLDGAQGPAGPAGAPGPTGIASIVSAQAVTTLCAGTVACSIGSAQAVCPAGTRPISGGVTSAAYNGTFVDTMTTSNGWVGAADNWDGVSSEQLTVFVYCSAGVQSITFPDGTVRSGNHAPSTAQLIEAKRASHSAAP